MYLTIPLYSLIVFRMCVCEFWLGVFAPGQCPDFCIRIHDASAYSLIVVFMGVSPRSISMPAVGVDLMVPVIILHASLCILFNMVLFSLFSSPVIQTTAP